MRDPALLADSNYRPCYRLVERFPIHTDPPLVGEVWRPAGPRARPSGRLIVVRRTIDGPVIYSTDDCYDLANATSKLDCWLSEQETQCH